MSIFPKERSSLATRQCVWNHFKKSHSFKHRYVSLSLLDEGLVGTMRKLSNRVHVSIDVGEFHIINDEGLSKGTDNQLNQQTVLVTSYGRCWRKKMLIALFTSIRLPTSLCWFKWWQGPPIDNTGFQLQILNIYSSVLRLKLLYTVFQNQKWLCHSVSEWQCHLLSCQTLVWTAKKVVWCSVVFRLNASKLSISKMYFHAVKNLSTAGVL